MADYWTHFAARLSLPSAEQVEIAQGLYFTLAERTGQPLQPATDVIQPLDLSVTELSDLHAALALAIVASSKPSEEALTLTPLIERLNRLQERVLAGHALLTSAVQDAPAKEQRASTSP